MVAFENLYFTDKKLRRTINQLEKMAPASRQSLRRMVFVIAIEQFWSIGTTLCDIYTSNKHIFSNDVNESLVACLVILEGIAADLWPLLRKLASQQRLALFQRNVANLKEPLLSLDHPLLYMSFVHYQVTPFKDDHIDGYGILLANELILVSKTNDTEREFTMQFRINWQGMQVQRAKYRNAFVGYGISIQSPYVSGIRIYIGDKKPVVQHGPFVMTNEEGITNTMLDYQANSNGFERARKWRSGISGRH
ncbi:hypothetical protein BDF22DRAFT_776770 [Syncephalis plumigaleata]|nr:hypothetical protein BDF22DRAFT_776770 [Syncephalis plumigaleata]